MHPSIEPIIHQVVQELQGELGSDLVGIVLVGSFAYGTPRKYSDIDLYVIIRPPWRQRRVIVREGMEIEMLLNPLFQVERELVNVGEPATILMFAQGRILADSENQARELADEARRIWQLGPPALPSADYPLVRQRPEHLFQSAYGMSEEDEDAAFLLVMAALEAALDSYYCLARRWPVKRKEQLQDLHEHAPHLELLVRDVLAPTASIQVRLAALRMLLDRIYAPLGDRTTEWHTPREELVAPAAERRLSTR
jgi:predicted nucleotidyltransferase